MGVHVPPAHARFNNKMYEKFIDVDVMKSMTELTSKPKHRVSTLRFGMLRVLLFPLYRRFWCSAIGLPCLTWLGISLLYICQLAACVLHYTYLSDASPHITASEVYFPPLLLLFSGFCFGRIPTAGADKIKELHSSPFAKSHPHSAATHKDRLPALVVTPRNVPRLPGSRGFHPPPRIDVSVPESSRRASGGGGGSGNGASEPQKLAPFSPHDRLRPCTSSNSNSSGEASASAVRTNTKLRRGRKATGGGVRAALAASAAAAAAAPASASVAPEAAGGAAAGQPKQKAKQKPPTPPPTTACAAAAGGASSSSSRPSMPPVGDYLDGAVLVSTPMAAMVASFRSGASSALDTQASAAAAAAVAAVGGGEEALCASRTASSREMRQEQYTVQNEAEEQITESDEDSDDSATEEVSAGAAGSGVDTGRGLLPPTLEASVEGAREALLAEDEPLSKIDDISVLLWVDEALLNAAPIEGIYSRKAEMMRAPHSSSSSHPAASGGAAAAAGRKKRSRKRPQQHRGDDGDSRTSESPLSSPKNVLYSRGAAEHRRSSAASSAGGSQATSPSGRCAAAAAAAQTQRVPVKSGMTVIEIRRCILACVDRACATEASELDKPRTSAKFASLVFALFPSLYRVLFSLADRGARSLRALAAALLLLYGDDAPLCRGSTAEAPHASAFFAYLCPRSGGRVEGVTGGNYTEAGWNLHAADAAEAAEAVLNDAVLVVLGQRSGDAADSPVPGSPGAGAALSLFVVVSTGLCVYHMVGKLATYLSVAEHTYRKRYLYAKYFSAITSLRRSQRYGLPHFRLKNVQNVMAWLSLRGSRAWLRHESQEVAADTIVSITFQLFLFVLALVGMMVIQESGGKRTQASSLGMENFSEVFHGQIFLLTVAISYYLV